MMILKITSLLEGHKNYPRETSNITQLELQYQLKDAVVLLASISVYSCID
jgi:hypothetical protein